MTVTFDPFVAHHPAVLVHEMDGPDFERAWKLAGAPDAVAESRVVCPVCGDGHLRDRGTSPRNSRAWIRFSCGDVVTQEVTAG